MDTTTTSFTVAAVCTGVLAAMVFLLGFNVSRMRGVTAQTGGSQLPTDPASPLLIAQRAHGNATEYVPTLVALFLLLGALADSWWVIALVVGATAARLVHAVGMLSTETLAAESPVRMTGAMATYVFGLALAVAAVAVAV
jgi:uncharacterized membrane protein YecN with MAPEG domain